MSGSCGLFLSPAAVTHSASPVLDPGAKDQEGSIGGDVGGGGDFES
ncbi:MAG: hypothetical protein QOH48_860 [Actinomycetota bacterium]|jgi:hypothetical protein|nr:hypothetical protein [Actinomycetota bacterium]